ncbi:MAG: serine hydrolase [Ignavibacteria bacterium RIFOXYB2_FULL_35_12]|nr:MAG: serine hydrolase [Ignavibacteria bacterium GWA2_36_19]OGU53569.1 MAG: serine hydrolase [Ignavibacteria bacterium GWC2_35_8]OGU60133.1 MAG: serine hydrolase [Ignavibacteria bacterium GWF2_35_20]OGU78423.1 MAG: serine hydrolase [Ignavibacteria bacterium RIFOXYA2_FULL_35_9]OGU88508.1 MAG: serine hydrolase [Ignavibacteria bacterium RIFOXYC12_FULL_35_11]OGU91291.1 MAG: serine hydrolase [Ignavibacteria bacterium RIFOXYA12_FULL_35_25]OGU96931.1 MAG: serine hydrolase [Ignavibacteria bacterium
MLNFFLIIFFIISIRQMHAQNLDSLKIKIDSIFKSLEGDFSLAFKEVDNEKNLILINEKMIFHAASTMKTPVMIEVFKQAAENKFNLDDPVEINNEFKSIADGSPYYLDITDDSGEELYKFIGKKKTIYDLVFDMITVSSNLATNILIELVGAKNVTETMRSIGANDIQVLRGVEDNKAFQLGLNNVVTAFDLMLIYENLVENKFASDSLTNEMLNILLQQKHNSRIPAKLPQDVKVAHKTGSITGVGHDSGIVFLSDGRKYVLVLLSKNLKDEKAVIEAEAEVSKIIYDYVINN